MVKNKENGNLIVISGPSGCGKGTIIQELLKINNNLFLSISATTRNIRPGETENVNYYYLTKDEFEERINNDDFLEYAIYNGNYYGTLKSKIVEELKKGKDVILEIEIQGALKIKEMLPETIFIFIMPPNMEILRKRLVGRKTDKKDAIIERFKKAYQEINEYTNYNYVVVNDEIDDAVLKVNSIIQAEKCRVDRIEALYLGNEEEEIHELLIDKDFINNEIDI